MTLVNQIGLNALVVSQNDGEKKGKNEIQIRSLSISFCPFICKKCNGQTLKDMVENGKKRGGGEGQTTIGDFPQTPRGEFHRLLPKDKDEVAGTKGGDSTEK